MRFTQCDIDELLDVWPRLRRQPTTRDGICTLRGPLEFSMSPPGLPTLEDCYTISIVISLSSTQSAPVVFEHGGRIARDIDHHTYAGGALCLGSPWAIRLRMGNPPSLLRFVEQCVVPYLYAASWRELGHEGYPFSELAHGVPGLLDDYAAIAGLSGFESIDRVLAILSRRRRLANKLTCPCGCGLKLGRCSYRFKINLLRVGGTRECFRAMRLHLQTCNSARSVGRPRPSAVQDVLRSRRVDASTSVKVALAKTAQR